MNAQNPPVTITHKTTGTGGVYTAKVEGKSASGYLEWERAPMAPGSPRTP